MRDSKLLFFIGLICAVFFLGCAVDVSERAELPYVSEGESSTPLVVYLNNSQNPNDFGYYDNIRKSLNYAKIPIDQIGIQNFNRRPSIPSSTKVVVISDTYLLTETAMQVLVGFVANGGHIFIPNVSEDVNLGYLAGIKSNAPYSVDPDAQGIKFQTHFLPGLQEKNYPLPTRHKGLKMENFETDIEVLATAINDINYPVVLTYEIGRGKTILHNTTMSAQKADRGLYFAAILSGLEFIPYPIVNAGVIFLDDFPAPMYDVKKEPIASEMNITMASFVTDIWWSDMLKLSREENIEYTAVVCFDYREDTEPPFIMPEWETTKMKVNGREVNMADWLMRQVVNSGNEIAFHGYNHISLLKKDWGREDFMETAVRTAYKKWRASNYGKLPVTYVPPSNLIDSIGLASLEWGMPSIKYIASTYLGEFEEGGDREFDPEPYNRVFFDFPRITSGFMMDDKTRFELQSMYLYTGIWSHFVHPDDVYQIAAGANEKTRGDYDFRNPLDLGWRTSANGRTAMYPRFKNFIKDLKQTYPYIRFIKAETAAAETQNWRYERYAHTTTEDLYTVSLSRPQDSKITWWFAYASQDNSFNLETYLRGTPIEFTKTPFQDGFLYNIKTNGTSLSLPNLLNKSALTAKTEDALMAVQGYEAYLKADKAFATADEEIAWFISEGRVSEAVSILKRKIETLHGSRISDLANLATYLGYVGREFEIWPVIENAYENSSEKNDIVALSLQLVKNSDYPNLEIRKRWMERQMDLYPGNKQLLQTYLTYFYEETRNLSPQSLIDLIKTTPDAKSKTMYSSVLLDAYPEDFILFIADAKACADDYLLPLADSIAWWYANDEQYGAAIQWSACTKDITKATVLEWYALDGNEEYLKNNDFAKYIEYLLRYDTYRAVNLLLEASPCEDELVPQSTNIAYAYADRGFYRKAIEWAACSQDIEIREILQWYYELQAIDTMEQIFTAHIAKNPEDNDLKLFMAEVYAALGNIKKSWILASSLPDSSGKDALQRLLNRDVVYINRTTQKELLNKYPNFFYPEVLHKVIKELRLKTGNTLEFSNSIVANKLLPTSVGTDVTYGFYDGKENKHMVSATQYIARSLEQNLDNPANITHTLYGMQYGFKSKERFKKLNYTAAARLEMDEYNDLFYRLQAGISQSKDSLYRSISLSHRPAVTGPAYSLGIYNTNLTVYYEEQKFVTDLFAVFLLQGNYFSDSAIDGLLSTQIGKNYKIGTNATLAPYTEAAGRLGNTNSTNGFPYWTIEERLYGGLGMRYAYKNLSGEVEFGLEAAAFADTFSDFFQRYRGSASFPLFPWCYFTANAEFFTIKNFYSNNFNVGIKYYFDN